MSTILQPPTIKILDDKNSLYRFLMDLWSRSGGYKPSSDDLKGLTATVQELNTLNGINLEDTVQEQINSKANIASLGSMAGQESNNVDITGGIATNLKLHTTQLDDVTISSGNISGCIITTPTGSSIYAKSCGSIYEDSNDVGNVGIVPTNIASFTLLANTLSDDNSYLEAVFNGSFASNANNKRLHLFFGASSVYDSTALALNGGIWRIVFQAIRLSANSQKLFVTIESNNALLPLNLAYVSGGEALGIDLAISLVGTGVANNDIICSCFVVRYFRG